MFVTRECDWCAGRGFEPDPFSPPDLIACQNCGGTGRVEQPAPVYYVLPGAASVHAL